MLNHGYLSFGRNWEEARFEGHDSRPYLAPRVSLDPSARTALSDEPLDTKNLNLLTWRL